MSFWEIFAIFVSSAGTLASILGAFFAVYARQNGKMTREFIAALHRETQERIAAQHRETQEFIAAQHREAREVLERIAKLTVDEGEKTRDESRRLQRG